MTGFWAIFVGSVLQIYSAKDNVQNCFEIVVCCRVAVKIDATGGCEDSVHLGKAGSHEGEEGWIGAYQVDAFVVHLA